MIKKELKQEKFVPTGKWIKVTKKEQLSKRGLFDLELRRQLFYSYKTKQSEFVLPDVPGAEEFWNWYASVYLKYRRSQITPRWKKGPKVGLYEYKKPCGISYSGGSESVLIKTMWPNLDTFTVVDSTVKGGFMTEPSHGVCIFVGAALGYQTTFMGWEMDARSKITDEADSPRNFETGNEFNQKWYEYTGACVLSPLDAMTKAQVVTRLLEAKIPFCSCMRNDTCPPTRWCKSCGKCMEVYTLCHMLGYEPPFKKIV